MDRAINAGQPRPKRLVSGGRREEVDIGAGAPTQLPRGPLLWRAERGAAEIYLESGSGRRLIALVPEGGHVASMPHGAAGDFMAVGPQGARLEAVEIATSEAADDWVRAVAAALAPPKPEAAPEPLAAGAGAPPGAWRSAAKGQVVWLAAERMRWCGLARESTASVLPLCGPLTAMPLADAVAVESVTLKAAGSLTRAIELFTAELPAVVEAIHDFADARALAMAAERANPEPENGVREAVRVVAAALGAEPQSLPHLGETRGFAGASTLLRRAGLRARRIALEPGWSAHESGPLIAEETTSGGAVGLVWSRGAFRRPGGAAVRGGDEDSFARFALAVHAPLPDRVKGLVSLALHLLPGLKRDGLMAGAAGAGASLVGVLAPLATGWIFADIVPANLASLLFAVGVALLAGAFVSAAFASARALALQRIAGRSGLETAAAVADKVLRLPPSFFRGYSAGDLNQRIAAIDQLRQLVTGVMLSAGLTLIFSLFYFGTLVIFDPGLAALAFGLVLVYVAATFLARILQMRHVRRIAELEGKVSGASFETLSAVAKLRVGAAEERALARWLKLYREERGAAVALGRIGAHFSAFSDAFQTVTLMALFGVAAVLTNMDMPAGHFIGFLVAFGAFQGAFTGFCDGLLALFAAQPTVERARPIFAAAAETTEFRSDPGRLTGSIELSGVVFSYPGGRPLLDGIDLVIRPGEHVAIVGGSGSGKSTILRLLLGFEAPERGAIAYDRLDLSRLDLARVRAQIGVVMQSSRLFAGSIMANIRGASEAGLEACMDAAEAAGLAPDLALLPMGLHTPITEGAGTLSGGQRQRVLIARALVGRPPIQFLDEATSALDNTTQATVMRALERSSATRIVIAHRLSTVRRADRIAVLKGGRFAEIGTYDELMAMDGAFAALARRQLLET